MAGDVVGAWYAAWRTPAHARGFDSRARLGHRALRRWYEQFNDMRMLRDVLNTSPRATVVEIGCATGDMCRYLARTHPAARYVGVDISEPAIARARAKYPAAVFAVHDAARPLSQTLTGMGLPYAADIVYAKDVVHHQPRPLSFITELCACTRSALIMRCRTRDLGATVWDPDESCQYNWGQWTPYIVINVDDLVTHIRAQAPAAEIRIWKHRLILGGHHNRYLPKDCYLPETATAETAVGVFLETGRPGAVSVEDRQERGSTSLVGAVARRLVGRGTPRP